MPLTSRKFLVTLLALAAAVVLSYLGKLDGTAAGLIGALASAYMAGNVTQKAVTP
jgi:hypothetical protein